MVSAYSTEFPQNQQPTQPARRRTAFPMPVVLMAHCSTGSLFRPHVVRCTNITDIQLLTASSIPVKMNMNGER